MEVITLNIAIIINLGQSFPSGKTPFLKNYSSDIEMHLACNNLYTDVERINLLSLEVVHALMMNFNNF